MVYGSIINLATGEEIMWENAPVFQVEKDLRSLPGFRYGSDWKFSGDLELNECDILMEQHSFIGRSAVADLAHAINLESKRILLGAIDAYNKLPKHMQIQIDSFLSDNPRHILTSEKEVIDAYLNWQGIIGYTDTIVELVLSAYGVQK